MLVENNDTILEIPTIQSITPDTRKDFSSILTKYHLEFNAVDFYWQVGVITKVQGWILHLSVVHSKLLQMLDIIIPELIQEKVSFKIIRDSVAASNLLEGNLSYPNLGKLVSIYPEDENQAANLAGKLINLTKTFFGPSIPTDFHLGAIVYTRYGSFNPIKMNSEGKTINYIYDFKGNLVADPYEIPFSPPTGVIWPFQSIKPIEIVKPRRLLNNRYYPVRILKHDAKGDVIKALYFKRLYQIKSCIVKQGRDAMCMDDAGRSIKDRLKWQFQLYDHLHKAISMPAIFDYFEEEGTGYLVMEYIEGISLQKWISLVYAGRTWLDLSQKKQIQLLDCISKVLDIIERIHREGYIHRDITPENFLINKQGTIFPIDMELAWSINTIHPNPPFSLGTHGFISPEQRLTQKPTIKEDIYALGATMLILFTNLLPSKWNDQTLATLQENLALFIGDKQISNIICDCLNTFPSLRPNISQIKSTISQFIMELKSSNSIRRFQPKEHSQNEILDTIQSGIIGLSNAVPMDSHGFWLSKVQNKENTLANEQFETTVSTGWHTGIAGPLWLLARAKAIGFDISSCQHLFKINANHLTSFMELNSGESNLGLLNGQAGLAITIAEGLESNLMVYNKYTQNILINSFSRASHSLDLDNGIAGQGIALLRCMRWIETKCASSILMSYVKQIIEAQNGDGSWPNKNIESYRGSPGIILFLLAYLESFPDQDAKKALEIALSWLLKKTFTNAGLYKSNRSTETANLSMLGSIICLIRGYGILKNIKYRKIAEINLRNLPVRPVTNNFTLHSGLAGIGEILLEASSVFETQEWKERTNWIVEILLFTFQKKTANSGFWLTTESNLVTADLFQGTSGILHFLVHWSNPDKICHPLWPYIGKMIK